VQTRLGNAQVLRWYGVEDSIHGVPLLGLTDLDAAQNEKPDASGLADCLLHDVGTRLAHSARVARQVDRVRHLLDGRWKAVISDAAWLHDVGYSPRIACTGFHPLDGARWLRDRDWSDEICRLVAWHSAAGVEGALRGLDQELTVEFERPPEVATNALTWADLTSSPQGEPWSVGRRIDDILRRYPAESIEHRAIANAAPTLWHASRDIQSRLALETGVA
jgi:hypothetical protein